MPVNNNPNADSSSANHSMSAPRTKQTRARSPAAGGTASLDSVREAGRPPPPKRARKAINCEPCRNSKLKCDRNRPCSSCVLRGTTALCYQGQDGDPSWRADDQVHIDPGVEFNRIRQSLALLETHLHQHSSSSSFGSTSTSLGVTRRASSHSLGHPYNDYSSDSKLKDDAASSEHSPAASGITSTPGMLGQQDSGGLYAGPTSAASHLITPQDRDDVESNERVPSDVGLSSPTLTFSPDTEHPTSASPSVSYDQDLISLLPPVHTVDGLIEYYFEYCNWIYRHVNQPALLANWARFKAGQSGDRVVLATVCVLIALAIRYLPPGHALLTNLPGTCEDLGCKYYGIMRTALRRHREEAEGHGRAYTLDLVELLLVRCHYLTFAKEDPEETWNVRGELVSIGTAMGLHRDPGKSRFERNVAERRRWAWWHIILLERWQAFMFGRPLAIASHHFNTQLPSYCDPSQDKSGRLYLPNIALFRLAYVLGDIMDDAVSFRAVPYAAVQEKDNLLTQWFGALPQELDLDDYRVARSLASPSTAVRRLGVQSVIIRTAYHHIRFTLHRPYAQVPQSLETAVTAASALIQLVGQTRPDFLSNTALAVPGHMNWGPFHVFSAAMFFSFQLISHPDQPAASLFRDNIHKAMASLEQSRWMPVADKALTILQALAPLYSDELLEDPPEERERKKAQVLRLVKTLAFPYQDSPYSRSADSPGYKRLNVGADAFGGSAARHSPGSQQQTQQTQTQTQTQVPVSSMRWTPSQQESLAPYQEASAVPRHVLEHQQPAHAIPPHHAHAHAPPGVYAPYPPIAQYAPPQQQQQQQQQFESTPNGVYVHPADESSMWGASIGFGLGEWAQFLDVLQRPDDVRQRGGLTQPLSR